MSTPSRGAYRVLLVDDNPDLLDSLAFALRTLGGFRVDTATDGADGLGRAIEIMPHCVIIDVKMPAIDGYQLVRALRGDPATASIPLIVLSALWNAALARRPEAPELPSFATYLRNGAVSIGMPAVAAVAASFEEHPQAAWWHGRRVIEAGGRVVRLTNDLHTYFADVAEGKATSITIRLRELGFPPTGLDAERRSAAGPDVGVRGSLAGRRGFRAVADAARAWAAVSLRHPRGSVRARGVRRREQLHAGSGGIANHPSPNLSPLRWRGELVVPIVTTCVDADH